MQWAVIVLMHYSLGDMMRLCLKKKKGSKYVNISLPVFSTIKDLTEAAQFLKLCS